MTDYWAEQMGIVVDPVTKARREALAQGYAEGAKDGFREGYRTGLKEGYGSGLSDGLKLAANMCEDWPTRLPAMDALRDVAQAIRAVNLKPATGSPRNPSRQKG